MPFLDKITALFSSGAATVAKEIGDAFDKNFTSKEELANAGIDLERVKNELVSITTKHTPEG